MYLQNLSNASSTLAVLLLAVHHPWQIALWVLLAVVVVFAIAAGINYLRQRRLQSRIDREGMVLYGTVLASEPIGGIAKYVDMRKIDLRIQEPGKSPREVVLRTRTPPGQKIIPGTMLIVVVDPANPERIYPASADSAKRVVHTGTRTERKLMQAQLKHPRRFHQRTRTGYMPPPNKLR